MQPVSRMRATIGVDVAYAVGPFTLSIRCTIGIIATSRSRLSAPRSSLSFRSRRSLGTQESIPTRLRATPDDVTLKRYLRDVARVIKPTVDASGSGLVKAVVWFKAELSKSSTIRRHANWSPGARLTQSSST